MPLTNKFERLRNLNGSTPKVVSPPPQVPEDVKKRFPSMVEYEKAMKKWAVESLGITVQLS
jgi:hypothetical protein